MLTKKKLKEYLENKGIYEDVDEYLIDEFIDYLKMSVEARRDINKRGTIMNIAKEGNKPYFQANISVSILNNCIKNLLNISKRLGLSPLDRENLKIDSVEEEDLFD